VSATHPISTARLIPIALTGTLLLAACSSGSGATTGSGAATGPGSAGGSSTGPVAASEAWAHVHNLTLDGDRLLIGTHEGLWSQLPGQAAEQVSEQAFDVMGFAQMGTTMLSSGHPGEGQDAPADLGLQTSTDAGRTWTATSLLGEVDFHRLRAGGTVVQGLSAHDGKFLRSTDAGQTWTDLGTPPLFDFALDPGNPQNLIGTQEAGPVRSTDGGTTLTPIPGAPLLAFLAWTGDTVYSIAADGTLQTSTDSGATWTQGAQLQGQPQALAADRERVVALAGTTIWESTDNGTTFTPRVTGVAGH
jgi:hypothetical protein